MADRAGKKYIISRRTRKWDIYTSIINLELLALIDDLSIAKIGMLRGGF